MTRTTKPMWARRTAATSRITGFEFELAMADGTRRWVQLWGGDTLMCDGMVPALNNPDATLTASKACRKALMFARQQLVHEHQLRVHRGWNLPPAQRVEVVTGVRDVLAARVKVGR
jgi:hypothetical protein